MEFIQPVLMGLLLGLTGTGFVLNRIEHSGFPLAKKLIVVSGIVGAIFWLPYTKALLSGATNWGAPVIWILATLAIIVMVTEVLLPMRNTFQSDER